MKKDKIIFSYDEMFAMAYIAKRINGFQNEFRWLSNFFDIEPFKYGNLEFKNVETFYVAMKVSKNNTTRVRLDNTSFEMTEVNTREYISTLTSGRAKQFGSTLSLRHDWEEIKLDVMEYALRIKFNQPMMREILLATRDIEIVELNWWGDVYWGVNMSGEGENNLGKLIMRIRDEL